MPMTEPQAQFPEGNGKWTKDLIQNVVADIPDKYAIPCFESKGGARPLEGGNSMVKTFRKGDGEPTDILSQDLADAISPVYMQIKRQCEKNQKAVMTIGEMRSSEEAKQTTAVVALQHMYRKCPEDKKTNFINLMADKTSDNIIDYYLKGEGFAECFKKDCNATYTGLESGTTTKTEITAAATFVISKALTIRSLNMSGVLASIIPVLDIHGYGSTLISLVERCTKKLDELDNAESEDTTPEVKKLRTELRSLCEDTNTIDVDWANRVMEICLDKNIGISTKMKSTDFPSLLAQLKDDDEKVNKVATFIKLRVKAGDKAELYLKSAPCFMEDGDQVRKLVDKLNEMKLTDSTGMRINNLTVDQIYSDNNISGFDDPLIEFFSNYTGDGLPPTVRLHLDKLKLRCDNTVLPMVRKQFDKVIQQVKSLSRKDEIPDLPRTLLKALHFHYAIEEIGASNKNMPKFVNKVMHLLSGSIAKNSIAFLNSLNSVFPSISPERISGLIAIEELKSTTIGSSDFTTRVTNIQKKLNSWEDVDPFTKWKATINHDIDKLSALHTQVTEAKTIKQAKKIAKKLNYTPTDDVSFEDLKLQLNAKIADRLNAAVKGISEQAWHTLGEDIITITIDKEVEGLETDLEALHTPSATKSEEERSTDIKKIQEKLENIAKLRIKEIISHSDEDISDADAKFFSNLERFSLALNQLKGKSNLTITKKFVKAVFERQKKEQPEERKLFLKSLKKSYPEQFKGITPEKMEDTESKLWQTLEKRVVKEVAKRQRHAARIDNPDRIHKITTGFTNFFVNHKKEFIARDPTLDTLHRALEIAEKRNRITKEEHTNAKKILKMQIIEDPDLKWGKKIEPESFKNLMHRLKGVTTKGIQLENRFEGRGGTSIRIEARQP